MKTLFYFSKHTDLGWYLPRTCKTFGGLRALRISQASQFNDKNLFRLTRHNGRMDKRRTKKGRNRKVGVGRPRPIMAAGTQQRQQQVTLISCKWGGIRSHANEVSAPPGKQPLSVDSNLSLNAHLYTWWRMAEVEGNNNQQVPPSCSNEACWK